MVRLLLLRQRRDSYGKGPLCGHHSIGAEFPPICMVPAKWTFPVAVPSLLKCDSSEPLPVMGPVQIQSALMLSAVFCKFATTQLPRDGGIAAPKRSIIACVRQYCVVCGSPLKAAAACGGNCI